MSALDTNIRSKGSNSSVMIHSIKKNGDILEEWLEVESLIVKVHTKLPKERTYIKNQIVSLFDN